MTESVHRPSSSLPPGGNGPGFWERRLHLIARTIRRYELLDGASRKEIAMRGLAILAIAFGLVLALLFLL